MPTIRIPLGNRANGASGEKLDLELGRGITVAVLGANGAGKSAFLHDSYQLIRNSNTTKRLAEWLPAHRHISFSQKDYMITSTSAAEILGQNSMFEALDDARFRSRRGESYLQAVIQRVVDRENQLNRQFRERSRADYSETRAIDRRTGSVVDDINTIFRRSDLDIVFSISDGELSPSKHGEGYALPSLSDGERAALLLSAAILTAEDDQIIFIDEPEKHLNPAISQPLMRALASYSEHVGVVFASHDVDLISSMRPSSVFVMKDSNPKKWYDVQIANLDEIETIEHARSTILGGRKRTLLVEGTLGSLDAALYSIFFDGWNVQPVGSYADVIDGVRALKRNAQWHWIEARGLIDRDGREEGEVTTLEGDGIFPIAGASIESLLLDSAIMEAIAELKYSTEGGVEGPTRVANAQAAAISEIQGRKADLAAHLANWRFTRALLANKPSAAAIRDGKAKVVALDPAHFLRSATADLDTLLGGVPSLDLIGVAVPLKSSGAKAVAAKALGFASFDTYVQTILHNLSKKTDAGLAVQAALARRLPTL